MERGGYVYIITNKNHTVLYTGVTSNLASRIYEHKTRANPNSFSARYNACILVYYKGYETIDEAIIMEKKIKGGSRQKKINLIKSTNPNWNDLYKDMRDF